MKTTIIILQGEHGQIQRIDLGRVTGKETRAAIERQIPILTGGGFQFLGSRTIQGGGRRWALLFVAQGARR